MGDQINGLTSQGQRVAQTGDERHFSLTALRSDPQPGLICLQLKCVCIIFPCRWRIWKSCEQTNCATAASLSRRTSGAGGSTEDTRECAGRPSSYRPGYEGTKPGGQYSLPPLSSPKICANWERKYVLGNVRLVQSLPRSQ